MLMFNAFEFLCIPVSQRFSLLLENIIIYFVLQFYFFILLSFHPTLYSVIFNVTVLRREFTVKLALGRLMDVMH